jgi:hypothetical protein
MNARMWNNRTLVAWLALLSAGPSVHVCHVPEMPNWDSDSNDWPTTPTHKVPLAAQLVFSMERQASGDAEVSTLVASRSHLDPLWMHTKSAHGSELPQVEVRGGGGGCCCGVPNGDLPLVCVRR